MWQIFGHLKKTLYICSEKKSLFIIFATNIFGTRNFRKIDVSNDTEDAYKPFNQGEIAI